MLSRRPVATLVVIVRVTLVAATILGVFHVVFDFAFNLELGYCDCQYSVKCLLSVGLHVKFCVDNLAFVNSEWFR